jgi:hypothetical protein
MSPTKSIFFLLLASLLFVSINCKENSSITPPENSLPDTTSHNFTFTTYTFGGTGGSSYFKDVAIINDSDIWVVGAIYASPETTYNAAHWDGKKWSLLRVPSIGSVQFPPLQAIWPIAENNILLSWGGGIITFDGNNFTDDMRMNSLLTGAINKIYSINSQTIYCVGNGGTIVHYNGSNWEKQTSGTTIDLRDVWGSADGKTVWACGHTNDNNGSILLKNDGTGWKTVWDVVNGIQPYGDIIISLWGDKNLYAASNFGIYKQNINGTDSTQQVLSVNHWPYRIKGIAENNIAVVGDFAMIWHYNGATWKKINETTLDQPLYSVAVSKNSIVAVGSDYGIGFGAGLIYVGRRQ